MAKDIGQKRKERQKKSKLKVMKRREAHRAQIRVDKKDAAEDRKIKKQLRRLEMGKNSDFLDQNLDKLKELEIKQQEEEKLKETARNNFLTQQPQTPPKKVKQRASADVVFTPNPAPDVDDKIELE